MPIFGVSVVVIQDGLVLLQLRADSQVWNLPGGFVEDGESLAEAGVREVREETGLAVRLTRLVGVYSRPHWRVGGNHQTVFAAEVTGGSLRDFEPAETLDARFFNPSALPPSTIWWNRRMIEDAINGLGGGVARSLGVAWTETSDYQEILERLHTEPGFADRLRALFCDPPDPDDERLEVGP